MTRNWEGHAPTRAKIRLDAAGLRQVDDLAVLRLEKRSEARNEFRIPAPHSGADGFLTVRHKVRRSIAEAGHIADVEPLACVWRSNSASGANPSLNDK